MKFSKKKFNKKNKKKTIKHKILKKNISRVKRLSRKPKLTRKKKIGGAIDNKVMNKLFIKVVSDIQANNIDDIISTLDKNPGLINYQFGDNESSLLHQSCFYKKPEIIKLLIEKGADVNLISHDSTPLGFASFNTCFECIKILLANGANINGTDSMLKIPLMYALTKSAELFSKTNLNNNTNEDKNSYIDIIKYLINKGSDLNHRDIYGWTSIYYAIEYGATIQIIELLLRNGSDVRNLSNIGNSVLQIACKRRSLDVIKVLFDLNKITKLTINIPDNFGTTSLIEATNRNNFDIVDFLLNNGADPSLKDKSGKTALKYAIDKASRIDNDLKQTIDDKDLTYLTKSKENNTKIIKLLEEKRQEQIKAKLAISSKQNEKQLEEQKDQIKKPITENNEKFDILFSEIFKDIQVNNFDNIKNTLDNNPELINYQYGNEKTSLLQQAIFLKKPDFLKLFIEKGANVNLICGGIYPLSSATFSNCLECVKILLSNGVNINQKNKHDKTALMYALSNGLDSGVDEEIIQLLLSNGANLEDKDTSGYTALFYAINYKCPYKIIELLLKNGANLTQLNNKRETPLIAASQNRRLDIIKLLFDYGAEITINTQDYQGITALFIEAKNNNYDIVKFLLDKGADPSIKDIVNKTALKYTTDPKIQELLKNKMKEMITKKIEEQKQNSEMITKKLEEQKQNSEIIAQQLIEEEEANKRLEEANKRLAEAKKTKNKNKKNKAKEKEASEKKTVDDLPINSIVEPPITSSVENFENSKSIENSEQSELHLAYLNSLNEEAEQRLKLDTQKAIELSKETALLEFWTVYFDNKKENIFKLKENITTLMEGQNAYNLLKSIIPAYSNKYIQTMPNINNILSLLFILIGIISYQINQKNNLVYLLLKGGAAIQTVSSQLPDISYESNDLDIVIINNKTYNGTIEENQLVDENKMFAEKIGELLIWFTNKTNSILSMEPNKDEKYKIYKIKFNEISLIDLDYNVLPINISKLYTQDNYIKTYNIEPFGIFNGIFRCPSLINLIKEKMYYLIIYGSVSGIKEGKNRSFFLHKIPKSLNYLINVYRVMGNFNESDQDFYKRIFTYFFRDYPVLKEKLREPNDPELKIDGTLVPYTEPLLIQFLIDKLD